MLIPAEFLVNNRTIEWDDRAQEVTFYHIELPEHDVLLANGAAAESYRDDGNRWLFRNANSGWDQPPKPPCAPVLSGGPVVDAIWRRLLDRAGPRPGLPLTDDPDLHALADGVRVDAAERHGSALVFALESVPAALRRIVLRQGTRFRIMEAADPALADGFHDYEPALGLRWTDGDAVVPEALCAGFSGRTELVLHLACTTRYRLDDRAAPLARAAAA